MNSAVLTIVSEAEERLVKHRQGTAATGDSQARLRERAGLEEIVETGMKAFAGYCRTSTLGLPPSPRNFTDGVRCGLSTCVPPTHTYSRVDRHQSYNQPAYRPLNLPITCRPLLLHSAGYRIRTLEDRSKRLEGAFGQAAAYSSPVVGRSLGSAGKEVEGGSENGKWSPGR